MDRRFFAKGCAIAPLGLSAKAFAQVSGSAKLEIESLEVFRIRVNHRGDWIIPRLRTSGGLTGLGDASHSKSDAQVVTYLKQFHELLRGRSAFSASWLREAAKPGIRQQQVYGGSPAVVAASALEQCLFDIQGKALSVPAYDLFGGRLQQEHRVYANINRSTHERSPEGFAKSAAQAAAAGFDAIKLASFDGIRKYAADRAGWRQFLDTGVACIQAVRDTVGGKRDILVDAHSNFSLVEGVDLVQRLAPLKLYWCEEVCPSIHDLAAINKSAAMPTAGGEGIYAVEGFHPYIGAGAADIVMPDVKYCGGMMELKKICALAEGAGLMSSPHGPASPIGNAAAAHVVVTVPNVEISEFSFGEVPWRAEMVYPPEEVTQGRLRITNRPGLGFDLNEKVIGQNAVPL